MKLADTVKPINDYILVRELPLVRESLIYLSDNVFKDFFYGIILDVGKDVRDKTIVPDTFGLFDRLGVNKTKYGCIFEEKDMLMVKRGLWRPLGPRVLIKRDIEESITPAGIIIPACYKTKDQSRFGTVICLGVIHNKIIEFPLNAGDRVFIERWDQSIHEIGIGGAYHLSVPLKLIVYKENESESS